MQIVKKEDSNLMKVINFFVKPFCPKFMETYATTIGTTIYAPKGIISDALLAHESVHVEDYKKYGIWFTLSYLFCLPTVWTMRAYWEKRAYAVSLKWYKDNAPDSLSAYKESVVKQFTGSAYLWMWTDETAVRLWIEEVLK